MTHLIQNSEHEMNWEKRNSAYLADFDCRHRGGKRQSIMAQHFVQLLENLDTDNDDSDTDDEDDDEAIEKRLREVARSFGGNPDVQSNRLSRDSIAMDGLASSMRSSLNMNDVFDNRSTTDNTSRRGSVFNGQSSRMSLCSRRSARMSLLLRQSFLDSFVSSDADQMSMSISAMSQDKHHIPDVFTSKRNRRGSTLTQSTTQLLSTVFGEEAAKIASTTREREGFLLRGALDPIKANDLMIEISRMDKNEAGGCDDILADDMNDCEQKINKFVEAGIRDERRKVQNEVRMESIRQAATYGTEDDANNMSFLGASTDMSLCSSLTKTLYDRAHYGAGSGNM